MELHLRNAAASGPSSYPPNCSAAGPAGRAGLLPVVTNQPHAPGHVRGHGFRYPTLAERKQVRTTNVIVSP